MKRLKRRIREDKEDERGLRRDEGRLGMRKGTRNGG
jgi:hypothetical protein